MNGLKVLSKFKCLADKCPDTCCKTWSIVVDEDSHKKFQNKAPELLEFIEKTEDGNLVMKKHPESQMCFKYEDNLCSIHKNYGEEYLPKICKEYPRNSIELNGENVRIAKPSCPEIARLFLEKEHDFSFESSTKTTKLIETIFAAIDKASSTNEILAKLLSIARTFDNIDKSSWPEALEYYLEQEPMVKKNQESLDPLRRTFLYLVILIKNTKLDLHKNIKDIVSLISKYLYVELDYENASLLTLSANVSRDEDPKFEPILKQYLKFQILHSKFPFTEDRTNFLNFTEIIIKYSLVKIILNAENSINGTPDFPKQVELIQKLSRFLDHLSNKDLSKIIIDDFGWNLESNVLGIL
jgi:predicted transcriptional regulator